MRDNGVGAEGYLATDAGVAVRRCRMPRTRFIRACGMDTRGSATAASAADPTAVAAAGGRCPPAYHTALQITQQAADTHSAQRCEDDVIQGGYMVRVLINVRHRQ